MLINGISIDTLGIKLYDRVINSNAVDTKQEWLDGDIQPTYVRQQDRFKDIKLSFLVLGTDEDDAFVKISKLTQLIKKSTLSFEDISFTFDVVMRGAAQTERLKNGNFIVSYDLDSDYAKGEREIYTTDATATSVFRLTVVYYQNQTQMLGTEVYTIRAGAFNGENDTLTSIGINVDKYRDEHYNPGVATNLGSMSLTYENLQALNTLIINYSPIKYNFTVNYWLNSGDGYMPTIEKVVSFTYPRLLEVNSIGQLIDIASFKPDGYKGTIDYSGDLTVEDILAASPINVKYDVVENPQSKNITIVYRNENDEGGYDIIGTRVNNINETSIVPGTTLKDIIPIDLYNPNTLYYQDGFIQDHASNELVVYEDLDVSFTVNYRRRETVLYVEYYAGTYPGWYRLATIPIHTKYMTSFDNEFDVEDIGLDIDRYHTAEYNNGVLFNAANYDTYDSVVSAGVLQVYYVPIDFPLLVRYYTDDFNYIQESYTINALQFFNNPVLGDLIDLTLHRPEGYQFSVADSYNGEITLSALTVASPISIKFEEISIVRTKNVIVRYKQQLASAYSVINTSLLTISEADTIGGVRLKDIINLNYYRPEYYDTGILNGVSANTLVQYEEIQSSYDVLYNATEYTTPVYYYTDDVNELNWVGSDNIRYRVIDFAVDTTLYDLGLNVNQYKSAFVDNGEVQYNGPVSFVALRALASIDIVYMTREEPEDPSGINYPHRILFLQHNDLGAYENEHPTWTMNHAYINTGVGNVLDMSQLTIQVDCYRVDELVPLYTVNAGYAYLFGSSSPLGQFYMRYNNQTMYGTNLSGINMYEAKVGNTTNPLMLTEERAIGWSSNTALAASSREGYSTATFTYTSPVPAEAAQMPNPIYLFANNNNGQYADGLAGIGIRSCKIWIGNTLVRDFIPVQFYDKIGTQVAPSNCLYDKVSQTFFEDATGLNSFNIMDDEAYEDLDPSHKIGSCMVNYYKDGVLFATNQIMFRGDDFLTGDYNLYDKFFVDYYQPAYYRAGIITNLAEIVAVNFDNLNNRVFSVNYEALQNIFQANYYRDSIGPENLIATDTIGIEEKDFYQVPTFGDIVRLNKYKPEGYETNYQYPGAKVSLQRIMDNAPYNIVYTPIEGTEETYSTTIRYMKKVFGIRTYETIGTITLTLGASDFRDGEYIENYIDYNLMKPQEYYGDGAPYEWYEHDFRLDSPDRLQNEYIIYYMPTISNVEVRYYTDEIDELNLIATTNWGIKVDEFDGEFYLVDQLPNTFINKFKPVNCDGGILQNTEALYTFASLMAYGHIDIIYMTRAEPDDPTSAERIGKMLFWSGSDANTRMLHYMSNSKGVGYYMPNGGGIPYIDLGYTPKELGRLKVELKGYFQTSGFFTETTPYGYQAPDYTYGFGYYGALGTPILNNSQSILQTMNKNSEIKYNGGIYPEESKTSRGAFAIRGRIPQATRGVYTDIGLIALDDKPWYRTNNTNNNATVSDAFDGQPNYSEMYGIYRKGFSEGEDDNYNYYRAYKDYAFRRQVAYSGYVRNNAVVNDTSLNERTGEGYLGNKWIADPITYTLDAYHSYASAYDFGNSNLLTYTTFDESGDTDTFEGRCKPVGSLTLFRTRNPDTGEMNIMPFCPTTYPLISGGIGIVGFSQRDIEQMMNPFSGEWTGQTITTTNVIGQDDFGNPITSTSTTTRNVAYSDFPCPVYPQQSMGAIWSIKIWDQDRLVRDMIPVRAGEHIYDYVMPADGLFDLITEIFFGNSNEGGTYTERYYLSTAAGTGGMVDETFTVRPQDVYPLHCVDDPCYWGNTVVNYYNENNQFIANQYVKVPTWFYDHNTTLADELQFNDYKPSDYHLDGMIDTDNPDDGHTNWGLYDIYSQGAVNVYYKLRTFAKSVIYYKDDYRVGTRDLFFSLADIENANTLRDLNIDPTLYQDSNFKAGRLVFDESILRDNDVAGFIDAPSPVVIYDKYTKVERPDLLYIEYYRGGAYDDPRAQISPDPNSANYLVCNLPAKVLNPKGAIKYRNHYHSAMYEDEDPGYFIEYQVRVINPYTGIHYGPARKYKTLAEIAVRDTYTIVEERNGWGRLKEYYHGWIRLSETEPITGPGQNPDYDEPGDEVATIPFAENITITKLTIDRLWAYVPAEESWVKTEEISFNQAGKLYNALDISVIDLANDVNWTTAQSLTDVGIYPNNRRLQYHDRNTWSYDGAYTYAAFSDIHELNFVYPETIYNCACIYYKGHKDPSTELGRASFTYSISDWNPDWDHFIETSWRYDDNTGDLILPELYRDTPISLTWDYFGFSRNLFKPNGYYSGIYLWNPHPWDEEHIFFSFDELVRVGTQYVVYPFFDPHAYKYWLRAINSEQYSSTARAVATDAPNTKYTDIVVETEDAMICNYTTNNQGGIIIPYTQHTDIDRCWLPGTEDILLLHYYNQTNAALLGRKYQQGVMYSGGSPIVPYYYISGYYGSAAGITLRTSEDLLQNYIDAHPSISGSNLTNQQARIDKIYNNSLNGFMNFEMNGYKRFYLSQSSPYSMVYVASIPYHNEFEPMYLLRASSADIGSTAYNALLDGWVRIKPTIGSFYHYRTAAARTETTNNYSARIQLGPGLYHGVKAYTNNELKRYYIPVPKGMWYEWDNQQVQVPENGMLDIITGDFMTTYNCENEVFEYDFRTVLGQDPGDHIYSAFTGWTFNKSPYNAVMRLLVNNVPTYQYPDVLSKQKRTLTQGLCFPIEYYTSDSANLVDGTWFYSADQWIKVSPDTGSETQKTEVVNMSPIIKEKRVAVPLYNPNGSSGQYYYKYLNPEGSYSSRTSMLSTSHFEPITTYYTYWYNDKEFVFDGQQWIDATHTSLNTVSDIDILALAVSSLNVYSVPIADDAYKVDQYLAGDRIVKSGYAAQDPNWAYSNEGWFRIDTNFSVVEGGDSSGYTYDLDGWSQEEYEDHPEREYEEGGDWYYRDLHNILWIYYGGHYIRYDDYLS